MLSGDYILTKMGSVYKEVLAIHQEKASHQQKHEDISETLDNIKTIPMIAHELKKVK